LLGGLKRWCQNYVFIFWTPIHQPNASRAAWKCMRHYLVYLISRNRPYIVGKGKCSFCVSAMLLCQFIIYCFPYYPDKRFMWWYLDNDPKERMCWRIESKCRKNYWFWLWNIENPVWFGLTSNAKQPVVMTPDHFYKHVIN